MEKYLCTFVWDR